MNEKFCVDCKHSSVTTKYGAKVWWCNSPRRSKNMVTGDYIPILCFDARESFYSGCTEAALWFEPKQPKEI